MTDLVAVLAAAEGGKRSRAVDGGKTANDFVVVELAEKPDPRGLWLLIATPDGYDTQENTGFPDASLHNPIASFSDKAQERDRLNRQPKSE